MFVSEAIAANASLFDLLSGQWVICYFNLNMLYMKSVGLESAELAFQSLLGCNYVVLTYFKFLSLALNFFLCLDMILSLRSPLAAHAKRMKYYLTTSVVLAALSCFTTLDRF